MNKPEINCLQRVRVVLSHTSLPRNIGSVARAMKTMGLSRLYLVNPKRFPDDEAVTLASGAHDILDQAIVVGTLEEALAGCTQTVATCPRVHELSVPRHNPRQIAPILIERTLLGEEVALVFGTEMSGLSNEEVRSCNRMVTIPTNPDYSSLNLAQAVQILAYEMRCAVDDDISHLEERPQLAAHDDIERFYVHLEQALIGLEFLDPDNPKRLMPRLRRMFGRIQLEKLEVDIWRGILRAVQEGPRGKQPHD
ncbi:RNA methyltransferase [Chitinimonas arctica]|uniref:tRNA (cytidine/uridine-2'-O-)-methyltransferase TrmJ n=1 Tax=Chitinimonas arctica TaxID=2594795 RepID=A0A516SAE2_9NEIS|nr:RNA methyltransferase [Chitinimonas arctica]QDQ25116.1 RNA methyltransferase [Chitinimonas arctica]